MYINRMILSCVAALIATAIQARAQTISVPGWRVPMVFVNMAHCNAHTFRDGEFCNLLGDVQYFDWTSQEKAFVIHQLQVAAKARHLRPLQTMLLSRPNHTLHFILIDDAAELANRTVDNGYNLYLAKRFFTYGNVPFHSTTFGAHSLLHEFFHFYTDARTDDDKTNSFWTSLADALNWGDGWDNNYGALDLPQNIASKDYDQANRLWNQEFALNPHEAFAMDWQYSTPRHYPSLYSMYDVDEFFAELGSFLCTEPALQKILTPKVNDWIAKENLL